MQPRAFSLRDVPAIIYVSIALNVATTFIVLVVTAAKGIHSWDYETFKTMQAWRSMETTASNASSVLLPLGLLALARRQAGPGRALTVTGAALLFGNLSYLVLQMILAVADPISDLQSAYDAMGYILGFISIASTVLLMIGTQAFRRVTLAAAGLCVLIATSYWMPLIGKAITESLGRDPVIREAYVFVREACWSTCFLFLAAALAAQTYRAPDGRRAAAGFRLARVILIVRVYIAVALVLMLVIGFTSPSIGKLFTIGTPMIAFITMMIFAIALVRVATSDIDGMPRVRVAIGAAAVLWWVFSQLYELGHAYTMLKHRSSDDDVDSLGAFAIVAPVAAAIGLGLIGSGAAAIAAHRGDQRTAGSLTGRTIAVVVLSLASIGLQTVAVESHSAGTIIAMMVTAVGCALAALIVLVGILGIAATVVETPPVPAARVV